MRVRIYQLAKELGIPNKDLLDECIKRGIEVKSHSSSVEEETAAKLRKDLGKTATAEAAAPARPAAPKAKPVAPPAARAKSAEKPKPAKPAQGTAPPKKAAPKDKREPEATHKKPEPKKRPVEAVKPAKDDSRIGDRDDGKGPGRKKGRKARPAAPDSENVDADEATKAGHKRTKGGRTPAAPARPVRSLPDVPEFWRPGAPMQRTRRPKSRKPRGRGRRGPAPAVSTVPSSGKIEIVPPISVRDFSQAIGIPATKIIQSLIAQGVIITINDILSAKAVEELAQANNIEIEIRAQVDLETKQLEEDVEESEEDLQTRAPVVTFLGHVDHGKTSLLDRIRETNVTASEKGGITQHMGAYKVKTGSGEVTFLDTPGHEAFTEMRSRGAQVTDIVVLVVAVDDGVMPQTIEAINHARAAEVPIVVALNKCDLPDANPQRAMQQLATEGLNPQQWGGDTEMIEVSAITGDGVDDLLELLLLESELLELRANFNKAATGTVLESKLNPGQGAVATVLITDGTLKRGDFALAGTACGRIRSMEDDQGRDIRLAIPSTPVRLSGLDSAPGAGERFSVTTDPQRARELVERRAQEARHSELAPEPHVTLETLFEKIQSAQKKEARFILKADAKGSIEVITEKLTQKATDEIKVRILHKAVGAVTESDVLLADASDAIIIGFHVLAPEKVSTLAAEHGVQIRIYHIIYHLLNEVHTALENMLDPEQREIVTGHATVQQVFRSSKLGSIAGCRVSDGTIQRSSLARVARDGIVINSSRIFSLRRVKDDAAEVSRDMECGIRLQGFDDFKDGDVIEAYRIEEVARKLS